MLVWYLITFTCYGTHLHEDKGMVDRRRNVYGSRFFEPNMFRVKAEQELMSESPYRLDQDRRHIVLKAMREVSAFRGWTLLAAHVRTNHVHCVVLASNKPEKVMNDFKAHASRLLNESGLDEPGRKRWARHGSTKYLWNVEQATAAVNYVLFQQGEPMATYDGADVTEPRA